VFAASFERFCLIDKYFLFIFFICFTWR